MRRSPRAVRVSSPAEAMGLKRGGFLRTIGTISIPDAAVLDDAAALIGLGLMARRALESVSGGGAAEAS